MTAGAMLLLWTLSLPALLAGGYLGVLTLCSWPRRRKDRTANETLRFVVVVPSHNEEAGIAQTVSGLFAMDYPRERFEVLVVADNCTDNTAQRARDAGARVLERFDDDKRGKGYALEHCFAWELARADAPDAFVVVDADSVASPNLLHAFACRIDAGAQAMQAEYGVSNVHASWRTRLMTIALAMIHAVRSLGRERLGLSCGLRGNGMCFTASLLRAHPHRSHGLVEDVEYGIELGLNHVRVVFVDEATVRGEMVSQGKAAESQRRRWEGGRAQLVRQSLPRLLRAAWRHRSPMMLDLAIDLALPPLSYVVAYMVLIGTAQLAFWYVVGRVEPSAALVAVGMLGVFSYVMRGVQLSKMGLMGFATLLAAPVYVGWKILKVRPWRASDQWVRTTREAKPTEESPPSLH